MNHPKILMGGLTITRLIKGVRAALTDPRKWVTVKKEEPTDCEQARDSCKNIVKDDSQQSSSSLITMEGVVTTSTSRKCCPICTKETLRTRCADESCCVAVPQLFQNAVGKSTGGSILPPFEGENWDAAG